MRTTMLFTVALLTMAGWAATPQALAAGSATLQGTVRDYGGQPVEGATVTWSLAGGETGTPVQTGADGSFLFTAITPAAGDGSLLVEPASGAWSALREQLSWPDAATMTLDVQPGKVPLTVTAGGPWASWSSLTVKLFGTDADGVSITTSEVRKTDLDAGGAGTTLALPGTITGGTLKFWLDEGVELAAGPAVAAGETAASGYAVDESEAQRISFGGWASGKPGSSAKLLLRDFPEGWQNSLSGRSLYPSTAAAKDHGDWTSTGTGQQVRAVTIPSSATPGYRYALTATHSGGPLTLTTYFQVCTLKPSRTSLRAGARVTLTGVVPVAGHEGETAGTPKQVVLYKTTRKVSSPPTKWPAGSPWVKVSTLTADGFGAFRRARLQPKHTTRYVLWYPADDEYLGGYTSICTVRVY